MNQTQKLLLSLLLIAIFVITAVQGINILRQQSSILGASDSRLEGLPCSELTRLQQIYCSGK